MPVTQKMGTLHQFTSFGGLRVTASSITYTGSATSSISVTIPTVVAGDLILLFSGDDEAATNGAVASVTGFTEIYDAATSTADASLYIAYKVAAGTESGTSVTLSASDGAQVRWIGVATLTDVNATPLGNVGSTVNTVSDTIHNVPGANTTIPNSLVFITGSTDGDDVMPVTVSWASLTQEGLVQTTANVVGGGGGVGGFFAWAYVPTVGASGTATVTFTGAGGADGLHAKQFIINPK